MKHKCPWQWQILKMAMVTKNHILIPGETCSCAIWMLLHSLFRSYDQCHFPFWNRSDVKVKRFSTNRKTSSQGIFMWNMKILQSLLKSDYSNKVPSYQKVCQTPISRSLGQKCWYQWEGLVIRNTHVKYQSSSSY